MTTTDLPADDAAFDFNPLISPHREDPHLFYRAARARPLQMSPTLGAYMVTRYEDLERDGAATVAGLPGVPIGNAVVSSSCSVASRELLKRASVPCPATRASASTQNHARRRDRRRRQHRIAEVAWQKGREIQCSCRRCDENLLVATNFIVGRCTASAIASASRKSFF